MDLMVVSVILLVLMGWIALVFWAICGKDQGNGLDADSDGGDDGPDWRKRR